MKTRSLSASWRASAGIAFSLLLCSPNVHALGDRFSYAAGDILTVSGGLWTHAGSKAGTPLPVQITAGGEAQVAAATTDFVKRLIPNLNRTTDFTYIRCKLTVDTIPGAGNGDYFLTLSDPSDNRRCRLHIAQDTGGKFKLGVSFATVIAPVWQTQLTAGQAYTVVVRLNRSNKNVSLWVNPTSESTGAVTSTDTSSAWNYDRVLIRPSSLYGGIGSLRIDDLLVGVTWNEVVGNIYDVTQNASDSSATVNNATDNDLPGIQKSIDFAVADAGNAIVYLPSGTYHLSPASGTTTISGTTVISGTETKFLSIANGNGVTVDGSGSTLIIRKSTATSGADTEKYQPANVVNALNTQDLTIKELTIGWQRVPYSVATVSNVQSVAADPGWGRKYTFTATVDAGYPIPDPNGWMVCALSDLIVSGTNLLPVCNMTIFQNKNTTPQTLETTFVAASGTTPAYYNVIVRMPLNASAPTKANYDQSMAVLDGRKVVLRHLTGLLGGYPTIYGPNAFEILTCSNVMLRDLTLNAATGMGLKYYNSQGLTMRRVALTPEAGKPMSTAVDGAFYTFCRRGTNPAADDIVIDECIFRGTGDDAANIHAKFQQIIATPDLINNRLVVRPISGDTGPVPLAGDTYEFYTHARQERFAALATVTSATITAPGGVKQITMNFDSLPAAPAALYPQKDDFLVSMNCRPKVLVKDTLFESGYARGLILSTDAPVVRNCIFRYIAYNGIFMIANPFGSGSQGPGPTGAVFDSNLFEGCGGSAIATWSQSSTANLPGLPGVYRDLTITSTLPQLTEIRREGPLTLNAYRPRITISGTDTSIKSHYVQSAIYLQALGSTHPTNLTNTIAIKLSGTSPATGFEPAVFLNNVRQLKLYKVEAAGQKWRFTTDDLVDPPDFGDLPPSGPTTPDYILLGDQQTAPLNPATVLGSPRQPSDLRP